MRKERAARIFAELPRVGVADVKVEAELVDGPAPEAIADVARLRDAEEIAVGSRDSAGPAARSRASRAASFASPTVPSSSSPVCRRTPSRHGAETQARFGRCVVRDGCSRR
jgi:nucleotide-binding universal stress UspA family protein